MIACHKPKPVSKALTQVFAAVAAVVQIVILTAHVQRFYAAASRFSAY
jgi:hypothetical protein